MVPLSVIMGNKLPNRVAQGIFTEEDHLLQTVLLDRAHETFRVGIQIWGPWGQFNGLNSRPSENIQKIHRVERISVVDQIPFSREETINDIREIAGNLTHP